MTEELKTVDSVDLSPFKKMVMTIGELPTSFVESMTYYECLAWLVNYLQTTIIDTINNNAEVSEELQVKFSELKNFVDNYFENLDVQEEINNKLDEMVEDGTLEAIIATYMHGNSIRLFNTMADLLASTDLEAGDYVSTLGYYSVNDGGNATYLVTNSGTADNVFTFELTNNLYATLFNRNNFNVLQIGIKRNDETFDNSDLLKTIFKNGLNNTTVYFPEGTYYTTRVNYLGDNQKTTGLKIFGDNATIKLLHPDKESTLKGTFNNTYNVAYGLDELDFGASCTINVITLSDGKKFFYLAIADKTLIPDALQANMVIQGSDTGLEAYIASIDTSNPDGVDTARIYLYAPTNDKNKELIFKNSSNVLNEKLIVKLHKGSKYLYINLGNTNVPSYIAVNDQINQENKTCRVNNISTTYNNNKYIEVNCLPEFDIFNHNEIYLTSSVPFDVYSYTDFSAGILSLNKYQNCSLNGITFDGNNLEVSNYQSANNRWNSLITGGCKNITIENCKFINAIQGGLQIGGISTTPIETNHDFPENVNINN